MPLLGVHDSTGLTNHVDLNHLVVCNEEGMELNHSSQCWSQKKIFPKNNIIQDHFSKWLLVLPLKITSIPPRATNQRSAPQGSSQQPAPLGATDASDFECILFENLLFVYDICTPSS